MMEFKNKVAVITGAASGIGLGLAKLSAAKEMKVVLADVEAEALEKAASELKTAGADVTAVVTDVAKLEDIKNLAQKTIDTYEAIDLLINNAGVAAGAALWESTLNDCHLTKHGIVAISEQLYHDLALRGARINVSVLCPGFVDTRIMDAERNRPEAYHNDSTAIEPNSRMEELEVIFRHMIKNGMSPSAVAESVFEAIADERFFIFTHPELKPQIQARMEDILKERSPVLPPPGPAVIHRFRV